MPPDVLPLIRSNLYHRYVHHMTSSVQSWYSGPGGFAQMRSWEGEESGCLVNDMWCRDKMHALITPNMFWYALNQKHCVCLCVCFSLCSCACACIPVYAVCIYICVRINAFRKSAKHWISLFRGHISWFPEPLSLTPTAWEAEHGTYPVSIQL